MSKIFKISALIALISLSISALAQNNTNSPYTRYGYGEMTDLSFGKNRALGGTAIGMRNNTSINSVNPASYSAIDSLNFIFEFGASVKQSRFNSNDSTNYTFNSNFDYMAFQFPVGRNIGMSFGMLPYSFVGYSMIRNDSVSMPTNSGSEYFNYTETYSGTGGINQLYGGISATLFKKLSVGVNLSYLFGTISHNQNVIFTDDYVTLASGSRSIELAVRDVNLRYGVQYSTTIKKDHQLSFGAIAELKSDLNGEYTIGIATLDTITQKNSDYFESPLTLGFGASYTYKKKLTVGADFQYNNWSDANYFGVKDSLTDRYKGSFGIEYQPNVYKRGVFNRMVYRAGANMSSGYLNNNNLPSSSFGITFGLGLPSKSNKSFTNITFEYGKLGKTGMNLVNEDYFKISVNATFNEIWFFKRKFE